jgi:hypothetical protein
MAATNPQRLANDAFLIAARNAALSAGTAGQPANTTRAYRKPQGDFIAFCNSHGFDDGYLVTEDKVCAWLQEDVLQRTTGRKRGRRSRKPKLSAANAGSTTPRQLPPEPESSSDEESESEGDEGPLKWKTINVYAAAIAELYHFQVSMGLNRHPTFRGATFKSLMKGLIRVQEQRSRDNFEDRGAGGINTGYTFQELATMQKQLQHGANKAPQVNIHSVLCLSQY